MGRDIQNVKARGVPLGRHKRLRPLQIAELQNGRNQGVTIHTLMQDYRISKATVYRYLNEAGSNQAG